MPGKKNKCYYWKHKSAKGGTLGLGLTPFGSPQITNAKGKNKGKSKNPRAFLLESNFPRQVDPLFGGL